MDILFAVLFIAAAVIANAFLMNKSLSSLSVGWLIAQVSFSIVAIASAIAILAKIT